MKKLVVFLAMLSLLFMFGCGDKGSDSGKKQGELYGSCYPNKTCNDGLVCDEENDVCLPDGADDDSDADIDTPDTEKTDEDPDTGDTDEDEDDADTSDTGKTDDDSDTGTPVTPDEDADTDTSENPDSDNDTDTDTPETNGNYKISGLVQAGNATTVTMHECGKTDTIASANTNASGKFTFNADII